MKIVRRLGHEVNFVLHILDDHTREPPKGLLRYVEENDGQEETALKPLVKASGFAVFTNMLPKEHQIRVISTYYLPLEILIPKEVNPAKDIGVYRVKPACSYPFNNRTTVAYFRLVNDSGQADECTVCAFIDDESQYIARVMDVLETSYRIAKVNEPLSLGDEFILSGDGSRRLRVMKELEADIFEINMISGPAPMVGDKLYKALFTRSGTDGRGVVYFTGLQESSISVKLLVDNTDGVKEVSVSLSENEKLNLGDIVT